MVGVVWASSAVRDPLKRFSPGTLLLVAFLCLPRPASAAPTINAVVNAASYGFGFGPAAGSIATIFGAELATATLSATTLPLPVNLDGTTVTIGGLATRLFYASPTQINVQIPWECCAAESAPIFVSVSGVSSNVATLSVAVFGPAIFSINSSGTGQGAIQIGGTGVFAAPVGSIPGALARPARHAELITIFCIGLGPVTNQPATGSPALASPLSTTVDPPRVTIGGISALVDFAGLAPGLVGLYQINAQVPAGAPVGDAVPVTISMLNTPQSNTVTIAIE